MCGTEIGSLFKTNIEGSELNVCRKCSKFGKIISEIRVEKAKKVVEKTKKPASENERIFIIVKDYAKKIRNGREELGLKQEDFAKKINEKQALIHKMETGHFEPSIELARKLEKFLKIKLIEEYEEKHEKTTVGKTDSFTIGDIIKIKK